MKHYTNTSAPMAFADEAVLMTHMSIQEKAFLYRSMKQLYENDIEPYMDIKPELKKQETNT